MGEFHLKTPLTEKDVRSLKLGDVVYLTGTIITARDQAHRRALEYVSKGLRLPLNFEGSAIYHAGPIALKTDKGWKVVAAGPTTSTRMEKLEAEFIEKLGVRMVIGKGGMGLKTSEAMKRFGAVYCAFTGGAAILAANAVKSVRSVEWLDLGAPEALWSLEVENFGPLLVAIDSYGENLYLNVIRNAEAKVKALLDLWRGKALA
ncbi:MAG: FumA C-terminus/TtdB family hydratase beta subunit [Candidatus Nezhaarchaeales archaeon]